MNKTKKFVYDVELTFHVKNLTGPEEERVEYDTDLSTAVVACSVEEAIKEGARVLRAFDPEKFESRYLYANDCVRGVEVFN